MCVAFQENLKNEAKLEEEEVDAEKDCGSATPTATARKNSDEAQTSTRGTSQGATLEWSDALWGVGYALYHGQARRTAPAAPSTQDALEGDARDGCCSAKKRKLGLHEKPWLPPVIGSTVLLPVFRSDRIDWYPVRQLGSNRRAASAGVELEGRLS